MDVVAGAIRQMVTDRRVFAATRDVFKSNAGLLKDGARFFDAYGRWYISSQLMAIRRQTDPEPRSASLRALLEEIATVLESVPSGENNIGAFHRLAEVALDPSSAAAAIRADISALLAVTKDSRRITRRNVEHAMMDNPDLHFQFDDIDRCIEPINKLGCKWVAKLNGTALATLESPEEREWSVIFDRAWRDGSPWTPPYQVGADGVPYDAIAPSRDIEDLVPRLVIGVEAPFPTGDGLVLPIEVTNRGPGRARDVRIFLPGVDVYSPGLTISPNRSTPPDRLRYPEKLLSDYFNSTVQVIAECTDDLGNIYRQYAQVALRDVNGIHHYAIGPLGTPFRVSTRIVPPERYAVWG